MKASNKPLILSPEDRILLIASLKEAIKLIGGMRKNLRELKKELMKI